MANLVRSQKVDLVRVTVHKISQGMEQGRDENGSEEGFPKLENNGTLHALVKREKPVI